MNCNQPWIILFLYLQSQPDHVYKNDTIIDRAMSSSLHSE
jgi:hypothetical protein